MTREQVHDLMENELRCVQRGNYCDRDCAKCPLVKDDKELIEAYGYVIKELEQEQEPKPMVEIDLYSVIKQKYIEREVLDKIRAEIESKYNNCDICEFVEDYDYEENDISEYRPIGDIADILEIIDKYKAESEKA